MVEVVTTLYDSALPSNSLIKPIRSLKHILNPPFSYSRSPYQGKLPTLTFVLGATYQCINFHPAYLE